MLTRDAVHATRFWCPYDRAWMSATLKADIDDESFIQCLNCRGVITRIKTDRVAQLKDAVAAATTA